MSKKLLASLTLAATFFLPSSFQPACPATESVANTLNNAEGENALNLGDYRRAETVFRSALSNFSGKNTLMEAYLRTALGEALLNTGAMPEASKELKKAGSVISNNKDVDPVLKARYLDNLSFSYQAQNDMQSSLQACIDSVNVLKSCTPPNPFLICLGLIHLGYLYEHQNDAVTASQQYQDAIHFLESAQGGQSVLAADVKQKLGNTLWKIGRAADARNVFAEALQVQTNSNAVLQHYNPHPFWESVIFPFSDGAPNCMRKQVGSTDWRAVTANGVTVAAALAPSLAKFTKSSRVKVLVQNDSAQLIDFLPQPPMFVTLAPKVLVSQLLDPESLAEKVEKKGESKAKWIRFWGSNATQTMTTTMIGNGGYWGMPPACNFGGFGGFSNWSRSGNMTIMNTQVPDYAAQQRAFERAAAVTEQSRSEAEALRRETLRPTTVNAHDSITGFFNFDVDNFQKAVLQLPVGNATFEFRFDSAYR